jgi:ribosome-associated protein
MKSKKSGALDLVRLCWGVLDDKKAEDLKVLHVGPQSSITDYLVIATATSQPHLRALRVELEKAMDGVGARIVGMETAQESGWLVIDSFDVMIHLFLKETREHFGLERLWRDAAEVEAATLTGKPPARKSPSRPKSPGKRPVRKSGKGGGSSRSKS